MEDKLKSLTEKLYKDGLKKGQNAADELIEKAQKKADKIIEEANARAKLILATAEKEANDKKTKVESELSMSAKQVISKIKNDISTLITLKNVEHASGKAFEDKKFFQDLILSVVNSWSQDGGTNASQMRLETSKELRKFIEKHCQEQLQAGLEITTSEGLEGFRIGPKDNSYKIEFTDESFISFFNEYLRPLTKEIIFSHPAAGE